MVKIRWIILAACLWLVFVVSQIPATWGGYLMTHNSALALSGVSGSLWRGRASMASIAIDGNNYSLGELHWELEPLSLLSLKPCAHIKASLDRQQIDGVACAGFDQSLRLQDTRINIPASLINGLGANTRLAGQLSAHIHRLQIKGQKLLALQGNLSWSNARVNNGQRWLDVGGFAADLSATKKGAIAAKVFSLDGPIDVKGTIVMPLTGGIHIKGDFALTPEFAKTVQASQWLALMSEPMDNGRHKVDMSL